MRNVSVNSGRTKTETLISDHKRNKEIQGITQRFLHFGRNDETAENAIAEKITLVIVTGITDNLLRSFIYRSCSIY